MKLLLTSLTAAAIVLLSSCTENERARSFGGTQTIDLPVKTKLVNVTWKEGATMWILTRPMRENETAETLTFSEKSNFGVMEGSVIFKESND
jgi:hypothetical protein